MKRSLTLLAIVLTLPFASGHAAEETAAPSKKAALAEELLTIFEIDKSMDRNFQQLLQVQEQMATKDATTPEQKAKRLAALQATMGEMKNLLRWETIKPTFIEIYSETFTEQELADLVALFKSPAGQKWIEKQPQLQSASMQKMQTLMMEAQPKLMEAIKKAQEADATPKPE